MEVFDFAFRVGECGLDGFDRFRCLFGGSGCDVDFGIVGVEDLSKFFAYTAGGAGHDEDLIVSGLFQLLEYMPYLSCLIWDVCLSELGRRREHLRYGIAHVCCCVRGKGESIVDEGQFGGEELAERRGGDRSLI